MYAIFVAGTRLASCECMAPSRIVRAFVLTLLVALPVPSAFSGELNAVINGKSFHIGASEDWNEENVGLGLEYHFTPKSAWKPLLMVNGFRDSNDDLSFMAGGGLYRTLYATDRLHGFYIDAGINAFLMTRKDVNNHRPFPGILPSLAVGNRYLGFNITYVPTRAIEKLHSAAKMDDSIDGIVFLQFKLSVSRLLLAD